MPYNPFDIFSSKIKRINIPIPGYKFFHKVSDESGIDSKFIGRENICEKLKNWLIGNHKKRFSFIRDKDYTGSYLVTGYRGMGKSSFVGKVLNEIVATHKRWVNIPVYLCIVFAWIACVLNIVPDLAEVINNKAGGDIRPYIIGMSAACWLIVLIYSRFGIYVRTHWKKYHFQLKATYRLKDGTIRKRWKKAGQDWHDHRIGERFENVHNDRRFNRLVIRINLGHEILNEKDILSLISKSIHDKFRRYVSETLMRPMYMLAIVGFTCIATWLLCEHILYRIWPVIDGTFPRYIGTLSNLSESMQHQVGIRWIECLIVTLTFLLSYKFVLHMFYRLTGIRRCLRNMQHLNDRIESTVNEDRGPNGVVATSIFGINLDRGRKKIFSVASVREIEAELIRILEEVSKIHFSLAPRFIIIFDELDKIDPEINHSDKHETNDIPEFRQKSSGITGGITSRCRKQNVLRLLANMKLFVLSANSKFIFIAGRELYDAFLADLSDREFAISSIFNGVIYVESFLTSDSNQRDITSMTECYISHQLIPYRYIKKSFYTRYYKTGNASSMNVCFKLYMKYLDGLYRLTQSSKDNNADTYTIDIKKHIESVMILLYHFSVYLSHISNGSPKKISIYFEKYVKKNTPADRHSVFTIRESKPEAKYMLSFGYTDQSKIGFIHYIAFPVVQSIINNASNYGDKLLISASFLIDHIYKHHNSGFSWRNIEHTPELLEVYRTPELRKFIASIISFLKQTHLSPIIAGLYQIKFRKKISEEISLLSKFSDEVSAIFNFTLDESLSVKRYYTELLEHYREKRGQNKENTQALSGIHHILGDLHMMDEEYTEAIFEYYSSLKILTHNTTNSIEKDKDRRNDPDILSKIRNMLKIGLAYERRNTSNSAYLVYCKLVCLLIDYRYIDENNLGMRYFQIKTNDRDKNEAILLEKPSDNTYTDENPQSIPLFTDLPESNGNCAKGSEMISELSRQFTPLKSSILMRLSLFEDIRLIYQALLAKLFVIEKIELGGISKENLNVLEAEYRYLHLVTNENDKFIISCDFFRKLAEIMYYKNGLINTPIDRLFSGLFFWGYDIHDSISDYCRMERCTASQKYMIKEFLDSVSISCMDTGNPADQTFTLKSALKKKIAENKKLPANDKECLNDFIDFINLGTLNESWSAKIINECNNHRCNLLKKKRYLPCYACKYYNRSLILMINKYLGIDKSDINKSKSVLVFNRLQNPAGLISMRSNNLSLLGHTLNGLGNVTLSCSDDEDRITPEFLDQWLMGISTESFRSTQTISLTNPTRLEKAILYYWDASEAFKLASNLQETSICHKNILTLLLNYIIQLEHIIPKDPQIIYHIKTVGTRIESIKENLLVRCLRNLYSHYEYTNMAEIQKIKWLFSIHMYDNIPLQYLSLFPDIEEVFVLYNELKLRCMAHTMPDTNDKNNDGTAEFYKTLYHNSFSSTCRIESTVYERIMVLYYKSVIHKSVLQTMFRNLKIYPNFYSDLYPVQFLDFYHAYIMNDDDLPQILGPYHDSFPSANDNTSDTADRKKLLFEFLVNDSLFCLTKILETISPFSTSTLYTNSFIAEIYQSLLEWNMLYESLFNIYSMVDSDKKAPYIIKNLISDSSMHENDKEQKQYLLLNKVNEIRSRLKPNAINHSDGMDNNGPDGQLSTEFFKNILNNIDKSNIHYTINNYLAEMAIKKYKMALEMHSEGQAYKTFIKNMYFLDDDLSNDTCQFDFAIERYKINCGYIDDRVNRLKNIFKASKLYKIDTYAEKDRSICNYDFNDV